MSGLDDLLGSLTKGRRAEGRAAAASKTFSEGCSAEAAEAAGAAAFRTSSAGSSVGGRGRAAEAAWARGPAEAGAVAA